MDLPAPLSCFSRGFAHPTSSLANSVICACANPYRAKNRSSHGQPEWVLRPWHAS